MEKDSAAAPITPHSLITEENVKEALLADKGKDAHLIAWEVVDFTKKGDNYACVVSSVEVKYSQKGKDNNVTYVVKLNPCRGFEDFEAFNDMIFSKEAKFYLNLVPELNTVLKELHIELIHFPICFHGFLESKKQQIYLEDLRPRGFKMFDKKKGIDLAHASLVLKELGKLHATSLLLEAKTKEPVEAKHDHLNQDFFASKEMLPMLETYVTTAQEMLKKVDGYERAVSWAEGIKSRLEDLLCNRMKSNRFNVVNHGDCWNNNLIFKYNNDGEPLEVMLLDLQICRKASCAIDLNYFLYTSMNGDVRKKNLKSLLSIYYNSFKSVMEAGGLDVLFTEDDLMTEFRDKNIIGGLFAMMVIPLILLESDDIPDMTGGSAEDIESIMVELRAKAMEMVDKNPIMKPRFLAIFDEFMETGLIP